MCCGYLVTSNMHMYSDKLNTTSSCLGTVWIDVILSYGSRRNQNWSWGIYMIWLFIKICTYFQLRATNVALKPSSTVFVVLRFLQHSLSRLVFGHTTPCSFIDGYQGRRLKQSNVKLDFIRTMDSILLRHDAALSHPDISKQCDVPS